MHVSLQSPRIQNSTFKEQVVASNTSAKGCLQIRSASKFLSKQDQLLATSHFGRSCQSAEMQMKEPLICADHLTSQLSTVVKGWTTGNKKHVCLGSVCGSKISVACCAALHSAPHVHTDPFLHLCASDVMTTVYCLFGKRENSGSGCARQTHPIPQREPCHTTLFGPQLRSLVGARWTCKCPGAFLVDEKNKLNASGDSTGCFCSNLFPF